MTAQYFILTCLATSTLGQPMPSNPLVDLIRKESGNYKVAFYPQMSDMTKCQLAKSQPDLYNNTPSVTLGGFIGIGYDDLHDATRLSVFEETYRDCKMTPDNSYFLPDGYTIKVLRKATLDRASSELKSSSELSMNMELGVGVEVNAQSVSGSFSMDVKASSEMLDEKEKTEFKMTSTNYMYVMKGNKAAKLSGEFESRIKDILKALRNKSDRRVKRLIEETYRDFGTNVVLEATLGSDLTVITYLDKKVMMTDTKFSMDMKAEIDVDCEYVTASASVHAAANMTDYKNQTNVDEKREFMSVDHVVALSRNYRPIYEIIHGGALRSLSMTMLEIQQMRMNFEAVFKEYIERNTYYGCTDREFANFDRQANVDDNTCAEDYCELTEITVKCQLHEVVKIVGLKNRTKDENEEEMACYELAKTTKNGTMQGVIKPKWYQRENTKQKEENEETKNKANKDYKNDIVECRKKHKHFEFQSAFNYTSVKVDDNFFKKADQKDYIDCTSKGLFVRDDAGKVDHPNWNTRNSREGGMFQRCNITSESERIISELKKLNIDEPNPCNNLESRNIYTNDFKCPNNDAVEIYNYSTLLPDRVHQYWNHVCHDDEKVGCVDVKIDFSIRHSVEISSFWCGKDQNASVYYAGVFDRGQINSYFGNSGCPIGTTAYPFFHSTTFCLTTNAILGNDKTAELVRLFKGTDDPNYCKGKTSKQLITVIGITRIYACILKKAAYFHLPPRTAVRMPFQEVGLSIDEYAESTATIYFHDKPAETRTMKSLGPNLVDFVNNVTKTFMDKLEAKLNVTNVTNTQMQSEGESDGFFDPSVIIIIVVDIALLFCLICLCTRR
uniref:Macrophage-expressed gene 1 protein n=1 Tax=Panagrellus redivivus TaxID=6233 RepID=A0A7E4VR46_PANRE